jgi:hypothetical protein
MKSPSEQTFRLFSQLPAEIRLKIWRDCLPCRVLELDVPINEFMFDMDRFALPCPSNQAITRINAQPPLIARVCHEARAVAFETGGFLPIPDREKDNDVIFSWHCEAEPHWWLDRAYTDSIHLGWEPNNEIGYFDSSGDPLCFLMWMAAQTKKQHSVRCSIRLPLLFSFQYYPDMPGEKWTNAELAAVLRQRPEWTVIIVDPVVVHASATTAAGWGLFGLLGDARVRIVDADDNMQIDKFLVMCQDVPRSNFSEVMASAKQDLREAIIAICGSEDTAPTMRPAIMFRLCTKTHTV